MCKHTQKGIQFHPKPAFARIFIYFISPFINCGETLKSGLHEFVFSLKLHE